MIFYSHDNPSKYLKIHLKEVSSRMKKFILLTPLMKDKDIIIRIGTIVGLGHDFGKYTTFFQNKLLKKVQSDKANHGYISAVFTYYLIKKLFKLSDFNKYYAMIAYISVLHHHGNLENLSFDCNLKTTKGKLRKRIFDEQITDIMNNKETIEKEYNELGIELDLEGFYRNKDNLLSEISKLAFSYNYYLKEEQKEFYSSIMLYIFSTLIDADKRDAGNIIEIPRINIPGNLVERYKKIKFSDINDNFINHLRESIYKQVINNINNISLDNHILSLTAPTGSGKTLTAFSAALKLRDRIEKEFGYIPRIIYSLPFTSIIDQNYKILRDVLALIDNFKENESVYIIKHHYLSNISYIYRDKSQIDTKELPLDEALQLIESWESEVIVTTFVQLLHTIIGYENSFLKKWHNIAGSIILLDEVQNIPAEYWPLVRKVFKILAKYYNTYIILLTATKPLIFSEKECVSLLPNYENYFNNLNRTKLIIDMKEKSLSDLINDFINRYIENKSYLIVLNTIASSLSVYYELKEKLKNSGYDIEGKLYYLSANIYPEMRQKRIEEISERIKSGDKFIVISTQVVEAGVDLDFDIVYRDLGPVDSIVQVAGRGNREADTNNIGIVYIYNLKEKAKPYSLSVYGSLHYSRSKKILSEYKQIMESDFHKLIFNYFIQIKKALEEDDTSRDILSALRKFIFSSDKEISLVDFQLIKEKSAYIDLFIENNAEARKVWQSFIENVYNKSVKTMKDYIDKKKAYLKIKNTFNSYIISVPSKIARPYISNKDYYNGIFKPSCNVNCYYDDEIGFKRKLEK